MQGIKKICAILVLASNCMIAKCDEAYQKDVAKKQQQVRELEQAQRSQAAWTGVAGFVGAAAGAAIGCWLAAPDVVEVQEYKVDRVTTLTPRYHEQDGTLFSKKARQLQTQLDHLHQYNQQFNLYNHEYAIVANVYKLGFRLDQIDADFFKKLAQDQKTLSDVGYAIWWHKIQLLEPQKNICLANANKLIAYFNHHEAFIQGYSMVNFYNAYALNLANSATIMIYPPVLPTWIRSQYSQSPEAYPLISYTNKVEADKKRLVRLQRNAWSLYPELMAKTQKTMYVIEHILASIYDSGEYQQQVERQRRDRLLAEQYRIEQERLELIRKQNQLLEQANRLAAEKNRIEHERQQSYYRHE